MEQVLSSIVGFQSVSILTPSELAGCSFLNLCLYRYFGASMANRLQVLAVLLLIGVLCMIIGVEAARGVKYDADPLQLRRGDFRPPWQEQLLCVILVMVEVKVLLVVGRKLKLMSPEGTYGRYDTDWNKIFIFCTFFFAFFKGFIAFVVIVNMYSEDYMGIKLISTPHEARTKILYEVHSGRQI